MGTCCGFGAGFPAVFFVLMILGMFLGLALLVILIWALVRWLNSLAAPRADRSVGQSSGNSAEDVLRERYARGEIDTATFEDMRRHLDPSSSGAFGGPGSA